MTIKPASEPGGDAFTWLGQAGFLLELGGRRILVDPWVSPFEGRLAPIPPLPLVAEAIDTILVTHEHLDHLDQAFLPVLVERCPHVRLVLPAAIGSQVEGVLEPSRIHRVTPGDTYDLDGLRLTVVPAIHGVTMDDAYGDGSSLGAGPRFVGYVLHGEACVYHAGDTLVTADILEVVSGLGVDVALLPINGRNAQREASGFVGNMDAREAVELATGIGARSLVPYHWDGVRGNTADPAEAVVGAGARLAVHVPRHFSRVTVRSGCEPRR